MFEVTLQLLTGRRNQSLPIETELTIQETGQVSVKKGNSAQEAFNECIVTDKGNEEDSPDRLNKDTLFDLGELRET